MSKPVLAIGLLAVMAGAWYWALLPAVPAATAQGARGRVPASAITSEVPAVRLAELARQATTRQEPSGARNPFRALAEQGPAPARASTGGAAATEAAPPDPSPVPSAPAWPRLELIGLAETRSDGALVRTAIVSGPQGVLHARPGDVLEGVYRLERISADGIDVRLLPEDRVLRFPLRQ